MISSNKRDTIRNTRKDIIKNERNQRHKEINYVADLVYITAIYFIPRNLRFELKSDGGREKRF